MGDFVSADSTNDLDFTKRWRNIRQQHCIKFVRIRSYSSSYSVQMRENTDHNNSKYGHFSRRAMIYPFYSFIVSNSLRLYYKLYYIFIKHSCYRTVKSAIWEIFSEFLIFCNLLQNMRSDEKICQYCAMQRATTTLSLKACQSEM